MEQSVGLVLGPKLNSAHTRVTTRLIKYGDGLQELQEE